MLDGDSTAAINFDRLQYLEEVGFVMFEYLNCSDKQYVNPWTSHPNRYWNKNKNKFIGLYNAAVKLNATLFLVNYASKGTKHEDKVLLIEVLKINDKGITIQNTTKYTRNEFKKFFKQLNSMCLKKPTIKKEITLPSLADKMSRANLSFGYRKFYIDPPHCDNDKVKLLGGKFDGRRRLWYYISDKIEARFSPWVHVDSEVYHENFCSKTG